jgi:hypothetical protein
VAQKLVYIERHENYLSLLSILMKMGMYSQIIVEIASAKFYENAFSVSGIVACGQSDRHFLRHFANAQKMLLISASYNSTIAEAETP